MERKREESASSAFLSSSPESAVPLETQQRWFLCVLFLIAGFFDSLELQYSLLLLFKFPSLKQ